MSKIENKARYYFGDKPVIEKAADEDEFEGTILNEIDLELIEQIQHLGLAAFWKQIWIELISLRCLIEISDYGIKLDEVSTLARNKYPLGGGNQFWSESVVSANKKGWGWSGDTDIHANELNGPSSLHEAVLSLLIAEPYNFGMSTLEMQNEPNEPSRYNSWKIFWNDACIYEQDLPCWNGRPERDLVLCSDGNTRITLAQKSERTFIVVYYFTS